MSDQAEKASDKLPAVVSTELAAPVLSNEELDRRQEVANAAAASLQISEGNIVKFEEIPESDYLLMITDVGVKKPIHRSDLLRRAKAVYDMLQMETGSADPAQVDKWIWLCLNGFRAALKNGRKRGKNYNSPWIKAFEKNLLEVERTWRDKSDYRQKR